MLPGFLDHCAVLLVFEGVSQTTAPTTQPHIKALRTKPASQKRDHESVADTHMLETQSVTHRENNGGGEKQRNQQNERVGTTLPLERQLYSCKGKHYWWIAVTSSRVT